MTWAETEGLLAGLPTEGQRDTLWMTTNPGLEDVVADELAERLAPLDIDTFQVERSPFGFRGNIITQLPRLGDDVLGAAAQLRSVHHVVHPLFGFALETDNPLDAIAATIQDRGVVDLEGASNFRVTSRRSGTHSFGSMDVQRAAGAALVKRYGLSVNLEHPDCEVRVDVIQDRCLVGVQLTRASLSRRKQRQYNPRGALKANVAYSMLRFSGLQSGRLLDPFCGSATIPIEAAQVLPPDVQIDASDYSARAVEGGRRNLAAAGLEDRVDLNCRDVLDLPEVYPAGCFDAIVTNPPFGVRIGRGMNFLAFYQRFFDVAAHLLRPGAPLVFLAWKRGIIDRANRLHDQFHRTHVRVVETGGIYPRIYVMQKRD